MEFYEPTCLFRQNAIRRALSPDQSSSIYESSLTDAFAYTGSNNSSSWLLNQNPQQDTMVMNKACALDRVNIKSNYWKLPDAEMNLTALALNDTAADSPLLAISSANAKNNLFIHELDSVQSHLTHHTTISLPNIHALAWVPSTNSRFLVSGNTKGYAHLVSLPRLHLHSGGEEEESAEIVKRFNHRKHLKLVNKDPSILTHSRTSISEMGFLSENRLVTCYDDTLFVWNMNDVELLMRPKPESISVVSGIRSFDTSLQNASTMALCGAFGVSLFDTRTTQHSVPKSLYLMNNGQISTNKVKWHPTNEHVLASSHADGVVRLWDIRKQDTFAELTGHAGKTVTSMSWNGNDLFSGASDGNIVHWDLTSNLDAETELSLHGERLLKCSLKEGIDSIAFDTVTNSLVDRVNERQCGTSLPALNNKIVGMCPIVGSGSPENCKILLIDGAAFLGLHCKIYDAANTGASPSEKEYYSTEDLRLIAQEGSSETFVTSREGLTRPLSILRKTASFGSDVTLDVADGTSEATGLSKADSILETGDFSFGFDFLSPEQNLEVVTLHLVESLPEAEVSAYSSGMLDTSSYKSDESVDSHESLSTVATLIGPADHGMQKDLLFQFLDLELERICNEFPGNFY